MKNITKIGLTSTAFLIGSSLFGQAASKPANHITNQTTTAKVDLVGCIDFTDSGQNLDVGYSSSRVEIVDYNNDGYMDFINPTFSKDSVVVWKNDGTGVMQKDTAFYMNSAFGLTIGDFNNDGKPDFAVGAEDTNEGIDIYMQNANDKFEFSSNINSGYGYDIVNADIDGDDDLDLIIAGYSSMASVWTNDGSGAFTLLTNTDIATMRGFSCSTGDIDGDDDIDLVFSDDSGIVTFENDGTGIFTSADTVALSNDVWGIEIADLNADGNNDIYMGDRFGQHHVLFGDAAFNYTDGGGFGSSYLGDVKLADIEGDGDLDALVSGISWGPGYNEVYLNDGTGVFTNSTLNLGLGGYGLSYGDFNGDNINDFLAGSFDAGTGTKIYFGNTLNAGTSTSTVTCEGNDTGEILVNTYGGTPPFEFSLDGTTYQTSNTFGGLAAGDYSVYIREQANTSCELIKMVTVESQECVGVNNETKNTLSLYPNPTTGILNINTNSATEISIFSTLGELVYKSENQKILNTIDLSYLENGIYQVVIKQNGNANTYKVMKM